MRLGGMFKSFSITFRLRRGFEHSKYFGLLMILNLFLGSLSNLPLSCSHSLACRPNKS